MKKYSKQKIDEARDYFRDKGCREVEEVVEGNALRYFVMPQEMFPVLKDFVYRCTGNPEDGAVFGVSDSVPEAYRKFNIYHEFVEFLKIGIEKKGRCVRALEKELAQVPDEIRADYIQRRINFFRNLISYCRNDTENFSDDDILEFEGSLAKLERMVRGK